MNRYKFVLLHIWNICSKPDVTLRYESLLNTFHGKKVLKHFILPLAELLFLLAFVSTLIYSDMNIASAVVKSIFAYLTFVVSYGILSLLVNWTTYNYFTTEFSERNLLFLVSSLLSVNFVVEAFGLLLPNMFVVSFFYLYLFYLVWIMSEGVVDIAEEKRNKYMVIISFYIFIIPILVGKLLTLMIPKL